MSSQLAVQFVLQLAVILLACRLAGALVVRLRQPRVIGEMIAGILLGPSLLGLIAPSLHDALFPASSLRLVSLVSHSGLVLYMFDVGARLQSDVMRNAFRTAMAIAVAGVIAPFLLGAGLAWLLHTDDRFFATTVSAWQAMMYLGAAMSVTAFPVLARIIQERGIAGTGLGTTALAAGAAGDVIAWCLLAIALAGFDSGFGPALAPFAAFFVGAALPRGRAVDTLSRVIDPVATGFLVPVFFAYSGLRTSVSLLWSPDLVFVSLIVIAIASVGKGGACWAAARLVGRPNDEAMALGALMNARGLMELIILNIGHERGLITPTLFTVMVVMTVATTLAAGPVFEWAWRSKAEVPDGAGLAVR